MPDREFCECGCEIDRHYSEYESTGDPTKPAGRVKKYYQCLNLFCRGCEKTGYRPQKRNKGHG